MDGLMEEQDRERRPLDDDLVASTLLIGGSWHSATDGATFRVEDPASEETLAIVADAGARDARRALDAAVDAAPAWAATPSRERSELLRRAFDLLEDRTERFAASITAEMGKPLTDARRVSTALLGDPRLRKLSFTGSTAVGRALLAQAAPRVPRTSMELGGNAVPRHQVRRLRGLIHGS